MVFGVRTYLDLEPSLVIHGQINLLIHSVLICKTRVILYPAPRRRKDKQVVFVELLAGAHKWLLLVLPITTYSWESLNPVSRKMPTPPSQGQSEGSFAPVPALCAGGGCMEG